MFPSAPRSLSLPPVAARCFGFVFYFSCPPSECGDAFFLFCFNCFFVSFRFVCAGFAFWLHDIPETLRANMLTNIGDDIELLVGIASPPPFSTRISIEFPSGRARTPYRSGLLVALLEQAMQLLVLRAHRCTTAITG